MGALNFVIKPADYEVLREILEILNAKKYFWVVGDSDIHSLQLSKNILTKGEYQGADVLDLLNQKVFYVFSELMAFNTSGNSMPRNYDEYLTSNCEIMIFIVDCIGYSVYIKDEMLFDSIKSYVSNKECKRLKELTKEEANFHFGI